MEEIELGCGRVIVANSNGRRGCSFVYYDSSSERMRALGLQGGGPTWAGIIYGLVAIHEPTLLSCVTFDPEADGLAVHASAKAPLLKIGELVLSAKSDQAVLDAAIARAIADGRME